jgi:hypothetical protein
MPEPDNFSPVEQLQDANRKIANKIVREYFKDVTALEADLDLTTSRQALLKACLHREDDSINVTILRNQLFYNFTTFARDQQPLVTGNLLNELSESNVYKPKITLFFREDDQNVEPGYQPVDMETSWRLTDETSQTITKTKLTTIANKIKTRFGSGNGYLFRKGRKIVSYRDKSKGYDFLIRSRSLEDGRELIRDILMMNGDSLETEFLKISEVSDELEAFPQNPGTQVILGKRRSKPRKRPLVNVRFRYAYASISGVTHPVYLYSRNWLIPDALVAP